MRASLIEVECRAEYRADESPCRAFVGGHWVGVEEILERWYQGGPVAGEAVMEFFKVIAEDGSEYLFKHDRELDLWFLERQW